MSQTADAGEGSGGGGGGGGDDQAGLLWDVQQWILPNAENSGGAGGGCDAKAAASRANSPSGPTASAGEKRSRNGSASKGSSSKGGDHEGRGGGAGESDHEIHIWTERERRKKMRNMFSGLHALLPQLPPKADKSTIVDEAVNYIKALQQKLQKLQKQKLDRIRGVNVEEPSSGAAAALHNSFGSETTREAFLAEQGKNWPAAATMNSPTAASMTGRPLSQCFQTWSSPNVVLSVTGEDAHISICTARKPGLFSTILCVMEKHKLEVVSATISADYFRSMFMIHAHASGVSDQFPEPLMVEEIYKSAVGEMILWLSS